MKTDAEIAREYTMLPITDIAKKVGLEVDEIEQYGNTKAKISASAMNRFATGKDGKLILVTAITPTPAGEGKTTVSIGLADGMQRIGKKAMATLREPSMGPVFGVKGGATGGGYAQIVPMEEINLHFTGDLHAISAANNLLAAAVDNHIFQGNSLGIAEVSLKRCLDMNDRQLRNIEDGLGGGKSGVPRKDGFDITAASEVMAVFCLSADMEDLKKRLGDIIVGYQKDGQPVYAKEIKVIGAMAAILKDAIKPNLVQTMGGNAALIHGGPFANIAHGCSSVSATRLCMKLADYAITEAGFGADLGAEKFLDIKCRMNGLWPDAAVLVATVRALKFHGGKELMGINDEDTEALQKGLANLGKHIENMKDHFGLPLVVAINRFATDSDAELKMVEDYCAGYGVKAVLTEVWAKGGEGAIGLAQAVCEAAETGTQARFTYPDELPLHDKIESVAKKIYGADGIELDEGVAEQLQRFEKLGMGNWPVCIAKTQMSLSDNAKLKGRPEGFKVRVRGVRASAGAGFVVALCGAIVTMPGLPPKPAAENIDIDAGGIITGIF